jgi:prepilin-type N-terminal cleavage/methylation domain-containing protein
VGRSTRQAGFSLVELTVVLLIVSVLIVVGMVSYARMTQMADAEAVKLDLITATKVQELNRIQTGVFSDVEAVLTDLEPSLEYSVDGAVGTVLVEIEPALVATDVCLFAQTPSGDWYAIHHSAAAGDRFAEVAPVDCTPAVVAGWSKESW